jgi:hypothetical protein
MAYPVQKEASIKKESKRGLPYLLTVDTKCARFPVIPGKK